MYSSSSVSKCLVLVPILAVVTTQLLFIRTVSSLNMTNAYLQHKCYVAQGKYKAGSENENEKHLNKLIRTIALSSNFSRGSEYMSFEKKPDFVSIFLQCRGDSYGPKCRSCYATAISGLQRRCPKNKGGIIWYDQCFIEISANNSLSKIDYNNNFCMSNAKNVSGNKESFDMKRMHFLDDLVIKATKSDKSYYVAGDERLGTKKLYGMVDCAVDMSSKACKECYVYSLIHFHDCMHGKQGARVLGRSCNFRFELYPFVDTKTGPK